MIENIDVEIFNVLHFFFQRKNNFYLYNVFLIQLLLHMYYLQMFMYV